MKCTFQVESMANRGAGIVNKTLESVAFQFHWIEFATDSLATNDKQQASATPTYLGAPITAGVGLNPVTSLNGGTTATAGVAIADQTVALWVDHGDTDLHLAGYVGEVAWLPQDDTPLKTTGYNYIPSGAVLLTYDALASNYASYNALVNTYNPLKDAYNTALAAETARLADPLKAAFEPAVTIPERPCPPTQPVAGWLPGLDVSSTTNGWALTAAQATAKTAGLLRNVGKFTRPSAT